ncbi:MAG: ABC transporter substrate-binding protein [Oscillospiraceae bacterium]|nr:ABC transporter substrate-binding protein [Oscillospiraceae bacterium]
MKRLFAVLAAAALMLTAAGCSAGENDFPPQNADSAVTFTDALGREVTVNNPEKAAALLGSFAEVWILAGGQLAAAPDDAWNDMDLQLSEDVLDLGKINELSLETLLSADPDFIIASSQVRIDLEWLDTIESTDIPIAYFDVSDFEDYLAMLKICTDITGRDDLYQKNGLDVKDTVDSVIADSTARAAEKGAPEVLSLRVSASYVRAKSSRGNVLGKMLDTLGCVNIADGSDAFLEKISIEYIIERDPDFIFVVQTGDDKNGAQETLDAFIADNPAWSGLTAVKEGRVYFMDKRLYNLKPNARWGEAYEKLEEILNTNYKS